MGGGGEKVGGEGEERGGGEELRLIDGNPGARMKRLV